VVVGSEAGSWVDSWAGLRRVSTLGAADRRRCDDFGAKSVVTLGDDFGRMIDAETCWKVGQPETRLPLTVLAAARQ